ncbi:MAG: hypothetical protein MI750_16585 [Xanthomonadales bacterium]|jgi:hypothetical protein|nr:hypothetical protein [Xanthomonadales bacterium]
MLQTMGWVLFGFAIWGLAILLHALQRRFAPDMGDGSGTEHTKKGSNWKQSLGLTSDSWGLGMGDDEDTEALHQEQRRLEAEVKELRERVQVLETIVTDKKFQFDQELNRDQ